jgi:hypothetical protein
MEGICPSQCGDQRNADTSLILLNGIKLPTEHASLELQQSIVGVDPGAWFSWTPNPKQSQLVMEAQVPQDAMVLLQELGIEASAWERAVNYIVERDSRMKFGQQSASKLLLIWSKWMACMQQRIKTLTKWWEGATDTRLELKTCDIVKDLQELEVWPDEVENNVSMWVGRCCCASALDVIMNAPILSLSRTIFNLKSENGLPSLDPRWESALHECTLGQPTRFQVCRSARPRYEQEGVMMYTLSQTRYAQEAADTGKLYEELMGRPLNDTLNQPIVDAVEKIEKTQVLNVMNQFMNEALSVVALTQRSVPLSLAMVCVWCCSPSHMALHTGLLKPRNM